MLSQVYERGEATRSRDLLLHIDRGYPEEAYFSFSYSPIHGEDGKVGGIFCPVIETTEKVIGERRLRTLRDLAASCKGAAREDAVYAGRGTILAANPHDIPFALMYRIDETGACAELKTVAGIHGGTRGVARARCTARSCRPIRGRCSSGANRVRWRSLADLSSRFDALADRRLEACRRTRRWCCRCCCPDRNIRARFVVAAVNPMRELDEDYRTFFGLIATQIGSALARRAGARSRATPRRGAGASSIARRRRSSRMSPTSSARR